MSRPIGAGRGVLGLLSLAVLIALVALPTLAAEPSGSPVASADPTATVAPTASPTKEPRGPKAARTPASDVTITGTVATRTDADGNTEYTMVVGGKTLVLEAGPRWFFGDDHPLKAFVGDRVTITGSQRAGAAEVDVEAVNGTRLRAAGKPPWAGGWKRVGQRHPGWSQEKRDRWQERAAARAERFGTDCFPPGQCKDKPGRGGAPSRDMVGPDAGG